MCSTNPMRLVPDGTSARARSASSSPFVFSRSSNEWKRRPATRFASSVLGARQSSATTSDVTAPWPAGSAVDHDDGPGHPVLEVTGEMAREFDDTGLVQFERGRAGRPWCDRHLAGYGWVRRLVTAFVAGMHLGIADDELVTDRVTVHDGELHGRVRVDSDVIG